MTAEKRYKRIGWVVKIRQTKTHRWYAAGWSYNQYYRDSSIRLFNEGTNCDYKKSRIKGLARCVPVYVEVKDG